MKLKEFKYMESIFANLNYQPLGGDRTQEESL